MEWAKCVEVCSLAVLINSVRHVFFLIKVSLMKLGTNLKLAVTFCVLGWTCDVI